MSILKRLGTVSQVENKTPGVSPQKPPAHWRSGEMVGAAETDTALAIRKKLKSNVLSELKNSFLEENPDKELDLSKLDGEITKLSEIELSNMGLRLTKAEHKELIDYVLDSITGYGPITELIEDETISEIMVNGYAKVYVERKGKLELTPVKFADNEQLLQIIDRIVTAVGRRIDESSPMVDARLTDGSRVNVIIPPLSLNGPILTIRKFSHNPYTAQDLINFGTVTPEIIFILKSCVEVKINMLISGGTGSGKTTTLNVLSAFIPGDERIVTIEDAAELKLWQEHIVSLETRVKNSEGVGEVSIRDLVKNSLRMRPDRIVVGEVRGGEALDMLQAMNTGHEGSLTTGHANSPRDMISRLETMVLMAGIDLPVRAIREQIASAIELIVHQSRLKDGTRRITHITEITGLEGDVVVMQDLFRFVQTGVDENGKILGSLKPTGILPRFYEKFALFGIHVPKSMFMD